MGRIRVSLRAGPPRIPRRAGASGRGRPGIGSGIGSLSHGLEVVVFDKGRGPGGRLSTRRTDHGTFDHGAPSFDVRSRSFRRWVGAWEHDGLVARWRPTTARGGPGAWAPDDDPAETWVARPSMLHSDYTLGVWDGDALVPVAKAYSGLTNEELREVDRWVRRNTRERFGPVRSVVAELVFEVACEGVQASTRHKAGVAVRFPRIARWRHDKPASEADTLDTVRAQVRAVNTSGTASAGGRASVVRAATPPTDPADE